LENNKPNIIVIMTDDQGYGDLSCMGSNDIRTPNIDRLAASGVRFTDGYSGSPVCSPSRACLLTGRYPGNAGVRAIIAGHRRASGLTPGVPTIATALRAGGYDTACIGKWHLGLAGECRPKSNGFDYFFGFLAGCVDYFSHIFYYAMAATRGGGYFAKAGANDQPTHDLWENENEIYRNGEYLTDLITDKSVRYIREHSGSDKPFFLYIGYNAPHYPMHAPDKYVDRFLHLPWDRRMMAAMISGVDDGVGAITAELERCGCLENTIIYYQSDNGPSRESHNWLDGTKDPYYGGLAGGLTGHKFSLYEGGIRIPMLLSWGKRIPAGQVIGEPVIAADLFPTLLAAAGLSCEGYEVDGFDLLPVVTGGAQSPHEMIFWEMGDQTAVRQERYKLVLNGVLEEHKASRAPVFLSDLSSDMSESVNLAEALPEITERLTSAALTWRAGIEKRWAEEFAKNYKET